MSHWMQIAVLSMTPVSELRGAIPLGILVYRLNPVEVAVVCAVFNMVPAFFIVLFFNWIMPYIGKFFPRLGSLINAFSIRSVRRHGRRVEKYGLLAITAFVAIPFPLTGAWTASLLSVLFSLPKFKSIVAICFGITISASLVFFLTTFGS